jgi:predicted phage baseplate assembly protein
MATNQSFPLKQRPLTFTASATASGADSSLSVQINGVNWHEVTSLHKHDRGLRAYMVRQDAKGDMHVIFGDGDQGAGIPTGTQQITASYRIGLGRAGNVPAGSLSLLQTAVPGIKGVTNPAAATGGSDPETMDAARSTAPLTLRAFQRIVSLTDFEDFMRVFPGIGKAQARQVSMGRENVLHLTIAGAAGEAIPKESDLYRALAQAIKAYRALPLPPLWMDSYELVYFNVQARVLIDPDQRGRMDAIKADIESALTNAFAFARREFGQAVAASEVIAVVQNIRGVVAVELVHFYIRGNDEKLNPSLDARLAQPEGETIHPAQLLLINPVPNDGIKLNLEIAP